MSIILSFLIFLLATCAPNERTPAVTDNPTDTGSWWQPVQGLRWQVQYVDELDLSIDADVFDLDLFETTEAQIETLHARGKRVICYINAGAWEDWRPDSGDFPGSTLGADYVGWPGERWLDIRQIDALTPILTARLDRCARKGFDGVAPDNLDGYTNDTGFPLTAEDQLTYNQWLVSEAHQRGLGIGLKNDPEQASDLVTDFDWATTESCFNEGWCDQLTPFIDAGKPVFDIEYTEEGLQLEDFCPLAAGLSIDAILKHRDLDAWRMTCP
jgi:hypothetical protein